MAVGFKAGGLFCLKYYKKIMVALAPGAILFLCEEI